MRRSIALVSMPWQAAHRPSLQLGILASVVRERTSWQVTQVPAYLDWLRLLLDSSVANAFSVDDYSFVAEKGLFFGVGDWVFSRALYGYALSPGEEFEAHVAQQGGRAGRAVEMESFAAEFIDRLAEQVLAGDPDVVGCTSTFMQNVPSLALLRRVKEMRPGVMTVLGGANCDGPMGDAIHHEFGFLDIVVRGEGEHALPAILRSFDSPEDPAAVLGEISGLCWRTNGGRVVNDISATPIELGETSMPDFDSFFTRLHDLALDRLLSPELVFEGSRGCWWGQKHHCTFCGLNGSLMAFREKPVEEAWGQLKSLISRYEVLDVVAVDNIMSQSHLRSLLPNLAAADWDVTMHFEVKSNLSSDDIELFSEAGIRHIQPGIESLITDVLRLMRKGVTATRNVRTLRLCAQNQVAVSWNILYGFPGEREEQYAELVEHLPNLWHLPSPAGAFRISLERFSPHFEDPSLGFRRRSPAAFYSRIYDADAQRLTDLAYLFDTPDAGVGAELAGQLDRSIREWQAQSPTASLAYRRYDAFDVILDGRGRHRRVTLSDPEERGLFAKTFDDVSVRSLERLSARAAYLLGKWTELGLVFAEGGHVVALPVPVSSEPGSSRDESFRRGGLAVASA